MSDWFSEHPILMIIFAIAMICFWGWVALQLIRLGVRIIFCILAFFLPFHIDYDF